MGNNNSTLYGGIVKHFEELISSESLQPGDRLETEMEIMARFEVSRATAIRALKELEYRGLIERSQGKGSFVRRQTSPVYRAPFHVISVVLPFSHTGPNPYEETRIIQGIEWVARRQGCIMDIKFSEQNPDTEKELIASAADMGSAGIILYPCVHSDAQDLVSRLVFNHHPVVVLEKTAFKGLPLSSVETDNKAGGRMAASHLLDQGYRKFHFVDTTDTRRVSSVRDRYYGFCEILAAQGLSIAQDQELVLDLGMDGNMNQSWRYETHREIFLNLVDRLLSMDNQERLGVFVENDILAVSLLRALVERKVKVPETVGIVGYGDESAAFHSPVPLTTIRQQYQDIGRKAAEQLCRLMTKASSIPKEVWLVPELVQRSTTGNYAGIPVQTLQQPPDSP